MKIPGMDYDQESISFSRNEWRHLLDEIEMRGVGKISQCINNARYLAMLDRADQQVKNGEGVTFTEKGWDDYNSWLDVEEDKFEKITDKIRDIKNKMELERQKMNYWKIDEDNDLVYITGAKNFTITSCKGHQGDK